MFQLKLCVFVIILYFSKIALACDPNVNCVERGPNYPCPTFSNPLRTCESYMTNPVCETKKTACRLSCNNINKDADDHIRTKKALILDTQININQQNIDLANLRVQLKNQTSVLDNLKKSKSNISKSIEAVEQLFSNQSLLEEIKSQIDLQKVFYMNAQEIESLKVKYKSDLQVYNFILTVELLKNSQINLIDVINANSDEKLFLFIIEILNVLNTQNSQMQTQITESANQIQLNINSKLQSIVQNQEKIVQLNNEINEQDKRKCPPLL